MVVSRHATYICLQAFENIHNCYFITRMFCLPIVGHLFGRCLFFVGQQGILAKKEVLNVNKICV